jgi:hypothetical protein
VMASSMFVQLVIQGIHTPIWDMCLFIAALLIPILVFLLWPLIWMARDEGRVDTAVRSDAKAPDRTGASSSENKSDQATAAQGMSGNEATETLGSKRAGTMRREAIPMNLLISRTGCAGGRLGCLTHSWSLDTKPWRALANKSSDFQHIDPKEVHCGPRHHG